MFDINADIIDSRELMERIAEIESQNERDVFDSAELDALREFVEDAESAPDWKYGAIFVRDDYFTEYTRELLTDSGYIRADFPSWIEIDWDATADNVRMDYTSYELDGTTYWALS